MVFSTCCKKVELQIHLVVEQGSYWWVDGTLQVVHQMVFGTLHGWDYNLSLKQFLIAGNGKIAQEAV
jgi:hypothetical protein